MQFSRRISLSEVIDIWQVVRLLFEEFSETSPYSVTTVFGRLTTELVRTGIVETDDVAQKSRLTRVEADVQNWRSDNCQLASTSYKRLRYEDPHKEAD